MDKVQAGYAKEIASENLKHIALMDNSMKAVLEHCAGVRPESVANEIILENFRNMDHHAKQLEHVTLLPEIDKDTLDITFEEAEREHQEDMQAMREDNLLSEKIEVLQAAIDAIGVEYHEVEPNGSRYYSSSPTYGKRRSHIIDQDWNNITIEQSETDEKWSKRITFHKDQLPQLAAIFLSWYQASLIPEETDDNPF